MQHSCAQVHVERKGSGNQAQCAVFHLMLASTCPSSSQLRNPLMAQRNFHMLNSIWICPNSTTHSCSCCHCACWAMMWVDGKLTSTSGWGSQCWEGLHIWLYSNYTLTGQLAHWWSEFFCFSIDGLIRSYVFVGFKCQHIMNSIKEYYLSSGLQEYLSCLKFCKAKRSRKHLGKLKWYLLGEEEIWSLYINL